MTFKNEIEVFEYLSENYTEYSHYLCNALAKMSDANIMDDELYVKCDTMLTEYAPKNGSYNSNAFSPFWWSNSYSPKTISDKKAFLRDLVIKLKKEAN